MGVNHKKVSVHDLDVGMFVSDLDRPWHQTPFPIQGFYIRSQDDIRALMSHCRWVVVDVAEARQGREYEETQAPAFSRRVSRRGQQQEVVQLPPLQILNPVRHEATSTIRREVKLSRELLGSAEAAVERVASQLRQDTMPDLRPLSMVAGQMALSVIRNPDALLWLSRVRDHDDYTYQHSLNTAVWALVLARHLGLDENLLKQLAMGCLLAHVGKVELPREMLANERHLDAEQFTRFKTYVERGARRLEQAGVSRAVVSVVRSHRERHNGSGFPTGVRGDRIPLLAKIAGLVDHYEGLIEPREGYQPLTPAQAVGHLFEQRNLAFQEDLVEQFIQAVGVYPTGTLVQLTDGKRGVVLSHSPRRRLLPRVMLLTDGRQLPLKSAKIIDLASYNQDRGMEDSLRIQGCLPFGTEGLHIQSLDVTGAQSRWSLKRLVGG